MTMSESEKKKIIKLTVELEKLLKKNHIPFVIVNPITCTAFGTSSEIVSTWILHGIMKENILEFFDEVSNVYLEVREEDTMKQMENIVQTELEKENNKEN